MTTELRNSLMRI